MWPGSGSVYPHWRSMAWANTALWWLDSPKRTLTRARPWDWGPTAATSCQLSQDYVIIPLGLMWEGWRNQPSVRPSAAAWNQAVPLAWRLMGCSGSGNESAAWDSQPDPLHWTQGKSAGGCKLVPLCSQSPCCIHLTGMQANLHRHSLHAMRKDEWRGNYYSGPKTPPLVSNLERVSCRN